MSSVFAERMRLRSAEFRSKNVFDRRIRREAALGTRILFASTELMHRPRFNSSLHLDKKSTYQIRTKKSNAIARRLLPGTLFERCPQVYRVKMTFELLPNNWSGATKNEFDEMLCKLDSSEYTRSFEFEQNPSLP